MSYIKVINTDLRCFYVDKVTLEPCSSNFYDPNSWANAVWIPSITVAEWRLRRLPAYIEKLEAERYLRAA